MYTIKFIDKLPYDYDDEYIDIDQEYNIKHVYYSINTMLIKPYIEILLGDELNFFNSTDDDYMISHKNLSSHIYSGVMAMRTYDIDCRFQGYHCCNKSELFLFYRISAACDNYYNNPCIHNTTLYDIVNVGKMYNMVIHDDVIKYFKTMCKSFDIFNMAKHKYIDDIPETVYSFIENSQKNIDYIVQNKTLYFLNTNKLLLDIIDVKDSIDVKELLTIRNIVFDKEHIISFKQILSFVENKYLIS